MTEDVRNSQIAVKWIKLLDKLSTLETHSDVLVDSKNKVDLP